MIRTGRYSMAFEKGATFRELQANVASAIETNFFQRPLFIVMHMDDIDRIIREEPVTRCENMPGFYFEIEGSPVTDNPYGCAPFWATSPSAPGD